MSDELETPEDSRRIAESLAEHGRERLPVSPEPQLSGWLRVIDRMIEKGTSPDILREVFALQKQADEEMQRKAFVQDFTAFKAEAPSSIARTKTVSHATSGGGQKTYNQVELDNALDVLTPFLSKHGLATSWDIQPPDEKGLITVSCRLEHVAGHSRNVTLKAHADPSGGKNEHQAIGSGLYYLERYTFMAVLGMAQAGMDDDAQGTNQVYLSDGQAEELNALISKCRAPGADEEAFQKWLKGFWKWLKCEDMNTMRVSDLPKAKDELNRVIKGMQK
jgi:hypothetical protein